MGLITHQFARFLGATFVLFAIVSCTILHGALSIHQAECKVSCKERLVQCSQVCSDSCKRCAISANAGAARNFLRYKHQQEVQGTIVALRLQSYRDPLQCRKSSCDCRADYQVCTQNCKGLIHKRLQVVPPC